MGQQRVATETLFYNSDKTKLVKEGDADAAFLFVRAGSPIDEAEAQRLNYTVGEPVQAYDAQADHARKHGGDTQQQADEKRARMFAGSEARGGEDPDGPAVEGERDAKSGAEARDTKAVSKAPSNKSAE